MTAAAVPRHPWRRVGINIAPWALAMPVIFFGASTPGAAWSVLAVVGWGTATGAVAGAAFGLVSGWLLRP